VTTSEQGRDDAHFLREAKTRREASAPVIQRSRELVEQSRQVLARVTRKGVVPPHARHRPV
jgi:hypothetical protein